MRIFGNRTLRKESSIEDHLSGGGGGVLNKQLRQSKERTIKLQTIFFDWQSISLTDRLKQITSKCQSE